MEESACVDILKSIAYSLVTKTAMKHHIHLHPHEKILTRGIEHAVSPTVLKLMAHRRKVVTRKVLCEQYKRVGAENGCGFGTVQYGCKYVRQGLGRTQVATRLRESFLY